MQANGFEKLIPLLTPPGRSGNRRCRGDINQLRLQQSLLFIKEPLYVLLNDWNLITKKWSESLTYIPEQSAIRGFGRGVVVAKGFHKFSVQETVFEKQSPKATLLVEVNKDAKHISVSFNKHKCQYYISIPEAFLIEFPEYTINLPSPNTNGFVKEELFSKLMRSQYTRDDADKIERLIGQLRQRLKTELKNILKYHHLSVDFFINQIIGFSCMPGLTRLVYVPGRGFMSRGIEESSFGYVLGCSKATEFYLPELQVLATLYGRETSISDWSNKNVADVRRHAQRSAVSAIFTHAFSHDIGSHGMYHLAEDLSKVVSCPVARTLASPEFASSQMIERLGNKLKEGGHEIDKIDLAQIVSETFPVQLTEIATADSKCVEEWKKTAEDERSFFQYLQAKSAFWASIVTIDAPAVVGDFVPDLIEFRDELLSVKECLLRNLVRSELKAKPEVSLDWSGNCRDVWLPYGRTVGAQAFFTVFEVIFRNLKHYISAKELPRAKIDAEHTDRVKKLLLEGITFSVNFEDYSEDYYKVTISDNRVLDNVAPWNNVSSSIKGGYKLLGKDLNPHYGGVPELLVCAALLRGLPPQELEKYDKLNPPLLSLSKANHKKVLAYEFYIWKGKERITCGSTEKWEMLKKDKNPYRNKYVVWTGKKDRCPKGENKIRFWQDDTLTDKSPFQDVRKSWLQYWLGVSDIGKESCGNYRSCAITLESSGASRQIYISHGEDEGVKSAALYMEGRNFVEKLFNDQDFLADTVEILETKIFFMDNRLPAEKTTVADLLRLKLKMVNPPSRKAFSAAFGREGWHCVVLHSSQVEDLLNSKKEEKIAAWLRKVYDTGDCKCLAITSGKSRPGWFNKCAASLGSRRIKFINWSDFKISAPVSDTDSPYDKHLWDFKKSILGVLFNQ